MKSNLLLFFVKGVSVLGALDDGPGGHQLHERPACEEHNLEVLLVVSTTWRFFLLWVQLGGISFYEHNL